MRAAMHTANAMGSDDLRPGGATHHAPQPAPKKEEPPKIAGFAAKILDGAEAADFEIDESEIRYSEQMRNLAHCMKYGSKVFRSPEDFIIRGLVSDACLRELVSFRLGDVYVPRRRLILNCNCKINGVNETAALRPGE